VNRWGRSSQTRVACEVLVRERCWRHGRRIDDDNLQLYLYSRKRGEGIRCAGEDDEFLVCLVGEGHKHNMEQQIYTPRHFCRSNVE
jgi:hypothetical protein